MIEPVPPMTASELHELFCRYCPDEGIAAARIAQADWCEQKSLDKHSVERWKAAHKRAESSPWD